MRLYFVPFVALLLMGQSVACFAVEDGERRYPIELTSYSADDDAKPTYQQYVDGLESKNAANESGQIWERKSIHELRIDIRETHDVAPDDRSAEMNYGFGEDCDWLPTYKLFAWCAPNIHYQPLYFEDVPLERYGQTLGLHRQPFRSGIRFHAATLLLPWQMWRNRPCECDYPLGFCRPGSCVPPTRQTILFGQ